MPAITGTADLCCDGRTIYYIGEVDIISGASMKNVPNILWLEEIRKEDIISVGGKGASLGEMASLGLPVPRAFVVTAQAFRRFLVEADLEEKIFSSFERLDVEDNEALEKAAEHAKQLVMMAKMPAIIKEEIKSSSDENVKQSLMNVLNKLTQSVSDILVEKE